MGAVAKTGWVLGPEAVGAVGVGGGVGGTDALVIEDKAVRVVGGGVTGVLVGDVTGVVAGGLTEVVGDGATGVVGGEITGPVIDTGDGVTEVTGLGSVPVEVGVMEGEVGVIEGEVGSLGVDKTVGPGKSAGAKGFGSGAGGADCRVEGGGVRSSSVGSVAGTISPCTLNFRGGPDTSSGVGVVDVGVADVGVGVEMVVGVEVGEVTAVVRVRGETEGGKTVGVLEIGDPDETGELGGVGLGKVLSGITHTHRSNGEYYYIVSRIEP